MINKLSKYEKDSIKGKVNLDSANDKLVSYKNAFDTASGALEKANEFINNLSKSDEDLAKDAAAR